MGQYPVQHHLDLALYMPLHHSMLIFGITQMKTLFSQDPTSPPQLTIIVGDTNEIQIFKFMFCYDIDPIDAIQAKMSKQTIINTLRDEMWLVQLFIIPNEVCFGIHTNSSDE